MSTIMVPANHQDLKAIYYVSSEMDLQDFLRILKREGTPVKFVDHHNLTVEFSEFCSDMEVF